MAGAGAPQGLSWSWELDFDVLLAALADAAPPPAGNSGARPSVASPGRSGRSGAGSPQAGSPGGGSSRSGSRRADSLSAGPPGGDDVGAELAGIDGPEGTDAAGPMLPATALAGRVAERLAPGPDLAAWLAMAPAADLDGAELAAVAGSWRRVAAWAQARELAAVAQIASRTAARDKEIGTGADGRPARVPDSAAAEVALELTMSQYGASWWTDLAVTLGWRLAATGAALDAGVIDLSRVRLIAEATATLSDETARAVEERVLPAAGEQTTGMLRAALRRAVIAADPQGAEERRNESERRAKVVLYPDEENTATLAGQRLPTVHAAAAMARIKAMARALKASGAGGGMDLLCAQVFVGLLLGTLPLIPPAQGAPPDDPPSEPDQPSDSAPPDAGPTGPAAPPTPPGTGPAGPTDPPPGADPTDPPGTGPANPPKPPCPPGDVPGQGPPRGPGQSPPCGSGDPGAGTGEPSAGDPDDHDPGAAPASDPDGRPDNGQSPGARDSTRAGPPRRSRCDAAPPGDDQAGQDPRDRSPASGTPPGNNPPGQRPRDHPPSRGAPPGNNPAGRRPRDHPPSDGTPSGNDRVGQDPRGRPPPSGTSSGDNPPASGDPPCGNDPPPHDTPPGQDPPSSQVPSTAEGVPSAEDVPPPGDADGPRDEDDYPCADNGPASGDEESAGQDDGADCWPAPEWPDLPAVIPPAFARPGAQATSATTPGSEAGSATTAGSRTGGGRSGLLDVSLPWQVLAGISAGPGYLGRIGPVTATQARRIVQYAADDPGTEWRIIVTTPEGAALAVTRIPRPRNCGRDGLPDLNLGARTSAGTATGIGTMTATGAGTATATGAGTGTATGIGTMTGTVTGIGLVSRVTLVIPEDLAASPPGQDGPARTGPAGDILGLAVRAAARAATRARAAAAADAAAGGCSHSAASASYRPPPRLRDYIAARDLTCRFLRCRQPAWRGDLDHTIAFDDSRLTCHCNLGGLCRMHHIIKHHPDWTLEQIAPGIFRWTTPSGRTFIATPDAHFV